MESNILAKIIEMQNSIQVHFEEYINIYLGIVIGVLGIIFGLNIYAQIMKKKKSKNIFNNIK